MLRIFDIVFSFTGLILGFPVLLAITIIGYFDTGSPIFCQKRVGRDKKPNQVLLMLKQNDLIDIVLGFLAFFAS